MRRADPWRRLDAALNAEANALRGADFSGLEALIAEKARLTDQIAIARPAPTAATLERLRARAGHNAVLLQAALRGLRAARARIEALQNGGCDLRTYDRAGAAEPVSGPGPTLERRA
ncbi:hypothetical protein ABIE69_002374 [Rhodobacteraceae bacterium MBR-64]|jgi:hypothetical protein